MSPGSSVDDGTPEPFRSEIGTEPALRETNKFLMDIAMTAAMSTGYGALPRFSGSARAAAGVTGMDDPGGAAEGRNMADAPQSRLVEARRIQAPPRAPSPPFPGWAAGGAAVPSRLSAALLPSSRCPRPSLPPRASGAEVGAWGLEPRTIESKATMGFAGPIRRTNSGWDGPGPAPVFRT